MPCRTVRAFTLTELAAVISIIGVLSAVATPSLRDAVLRARATEARALVVAIAHAEQRALRDTGAYVAAPATPPAIPVTAVPWPGGDAWRRLGVAPVGPVRFQYMVDVATTAGATSFKVIARADLDGDGTPSTYSLDGATMQLDVVEGLE